MILDTTKQRLEAAGRACGGWEYVEAAGGSEIAAVRQMAGPHPEDARLNLFAVEELPALAGSGAGPSRGKQRLSRLLAVVKEVLTKPQGYALLVPGGTVYVVLAAVRVNGGPGFAGVRFVPPVA